MGGDRCICFISVSLPDKREIPSTAMPFCR